MAHLNIIGFYIYNIYSYRTKQGHNYKCQISNKAQKLFWGGFCILNIVDILKTRQHTQNRIALTSDASLATEIYTFTEYIEH